MKFGVYNLAWLFLLLPALLIFYRWSLSRKKKLAQDFADAGLWLRLREGVSPAKQRLKPLLVLFGTAALIFSLLQPKWGYHWEDIKRQGIDLIVAVDTSKSMLAEDTEPSRLERAKREVEDLLRLLQGDRVGLMTFSGTAFMLCPLTLDYGAVQMFIGDISTDLMPRGGTNIEIAISRAIEAFAGGGSEHKALLLITDGENLEGSIEKVARQAKEEGIKIFTIGIGSKEGVPIRIPSDKGTAYLKDPDGNIVVTKLNEAVLQKIALMTGGAYHRATPKGLELDLIYTERIAKMEKQELAETRKKIFANRFQWPLGVAVVLLFLESVLGEKKRRTRQRLNLLKKLSPHST